MQLLRSIALFGLVPGLVFSSFAAAGGGGGGAGGEDEAVPGSRVAAAVRRTQSALERTEAHVDDRELGKAIVSLGAVRANVARAHRAAARQMKAKVDEEAEGATPVDSVTAVLSLEQATSEGVAGLFDSVSSRNVIGALNLTLATTHAYRDRLLSSVTGLDHEESGADYADGMADTLEGYSDEVANLTETLQDDRLSPAGRAALERALARVKATAAMVEKAFGGGE